MVEGMLLLRELSAANGRVLPELEALLAADPRRKPELVPLDDPLERLGRRYAIVSSRYLASHPHYPFVMRRRPDGPTPFEVFAWYHVLIAAKIYRAITSRLASARTGGDAEHNQDARFSARTALLGIDRSRQALESLMASDEDARLADLDAQLRRLRREVEARFPEARDTFRPGLDARPEA